MNEEFDNIFIWTGDSHVFAAIIKYVEDKKMLKEIYRLEMLG